MFSGVNNLVFLLIFLIYLNLCMAVCHRSAHACSDKGTGWEVLWKGFLYSLAALVLTVLTIYLWYIAVIILLLLIRYISARCMPKGTKYILIAGIIAFMVLVIIAGVQFRLSMCEDDDEDARAEEFLDSRILWEDETEL